MIIFSNICAHGIKGFLPKIIMKSLSIHFCGIKSHVVVSICSLSDQHFLMVKGGILSITYLCCFLGMVKIFFGNCRENYGCEVVCFTADVGQVCLKCIWKMNWHNVAPLPFSIGLYHCHKCEGHKRAWRIGREGKGQWGMSVGGEGLERGICEGLYISLLTSWCHIWEEVLAGNFYGPSCHCKSKPTLWILFQCLQEYFHTDSVFLILFFLMHGRPW